MGGTEACADLDERDQRAARRLEQDDAHECCWTGTDLECLLPRSIFTVACERQRRGGDATWRNSKWPASILHYDCCWFGRKKGCADHTLNSGCFTRDGQRAAWP